MDILENAIESVCEKINNFDEEVDYFDEHYEVNQ
jgi:diaminobutyrate-2-oxoglutarate transaminase